ncbi:MAG: type IV toxin-antitoxin system AbiEi family antitoxin domain-containing protein [Archangium sp.]
MGTQHQRALHLAKKLGLLRARDAESQGVPRAVLTRLVTAGELRRVARGAYALPDADVSEHHSLVQAATLVPHGVVCLLSALRFHELGTQAPYEVWLAIDNKAWSPRVETPPLRIVRFSGPALSEGIEEHVIEKVRVRIYGPAKTVVDCFRFRNKLGLDVALEALREFLRVHPRKRTELFKFAKLGRVSNVMQPYLEALT